MIRFVFLLVVSMAQTLLGLITILSFLDCTSMIWLFASVLQLVLFIITAPVFPEFGVSWKLTLSASVLLFLWPLCCRRSLLGDLRLSARYVMKKLKGAEAKFYDDFNIEPLGL